MMISVSDMEKNIVGQSLNAGYKHFLPFAQCFQKPSFVPPGIILESDKEPIL